MKKLATIILLVFAFTLNANAQKKGGKQTAEKMLKRMTKDLNLTAAQQSEIKPLLAEQIATRKAMNKKRKAMKDAGEKPSKIERKKLREERVANETAMNSKMATILSEEQFAKFETLAKEKKKKSKKKRKVKM